MSESNHLELRLDPDDQILGVYDRGRGQRLLESSGPGLLLPVFRECELRPSVQGRNGAGAGGVLRDPEARSVIFQGSRRSVADEV